MLERVRTAIIAPQLLIKYRKDRIILVLLFMMFFAALMAVGPVVRTLSVDGVSNRFKAQIEEAIVFPESSGCRTEEAVLVCDEPGRYTLFEQPLLGVPFDVVLDSTEDFNLNDYQTNAIVFHGEMMYVSLHQIGLSQTMHSKPISALHEDAHNLSFNPQDSEEEQAFFIALFNVLDQETNTYKSYAAMGVFVIEFLSGLLLFMVFVLLNSFLIQRRFKKVPFKQMFVMMTYASTLAFIVLIFYNMIIFNLFIFLILLFIAFRQTSKLAFEIQKRLYS